MQRSHPEFSCFSSHRIHLARPWERKNKMTVAAKQKYTLPCKCKCKRFSQQLKNTEMCKEKQCVCYAS